MSFHRRKLQKANDVPTATFDDLVPRFRFSFAKRMTQINLHGKYKSL